MFLDTIKFTLLNVILRILSVLLYNELSQKKIMLLNNYLDKIMKTTESQYGYIIQVYQNRNKEYEFHKRVEMYHMSDVQLNIPLDGDFNFLEDVASTLEFWNNQIMISKKPLIMNECQLADQLFTFDNNCLLEQSSWFILPISFFDKIVAIMGLIGSPINFNPYYYELLQPFMILCSHLLSERI